MELNFSAFGDSDLLMQVSEGVYYFDGKPIYIIEHIQELGGEYVLVYAVQADEDDNGEPLKKYRMENKVKTIHGGTHLSNLIKSRIPRKTVTRKVIDAPLFMAHIIPEGRDTVSGQVGKGFFERQPDSTSLTSKGTVYTPGAYTGVFITLSNIRWRRSYTPIESVISYYRQQKEERDNVRIDKVL